MAGRLVALIVFYDPAPRNPGLQDLMCWRSRDPAGSTGLGGFMNRASDSWLCLDFTDTTKRVWGGN